MPLLVSILQVSADVGATLLSRCSSCARRFVLSAELSFLFLISSYSSLCGLCGFAQKIFWIETREALRLSQILEALLHWDNILRLKIGCSGFWRRGLATAATKAQRVNG
jgi:hypothetical protein